MIGHKFWDVAVEALIANKVRSALTMLGIVIGVFSVIVLVGLGQASQAYVTQQVEGLGSGLLVITPGSPKASGLTSGASPTATSLTLSDADALADLPGVIGVTPEGVQSMLLKAGRKTAGAVVVGTNTGMTMVQQLELAEGRFFNETEARGSTRVIVLGARVATDLFGPGRGGALDAKVQLANQRFRVVGVLASSGGFKSLDDDAFMPTRAFQVATGTGDKLNVILLKAASDTALPAVSARVQAVLRQRHALRPDEDDDFKLQSQAELLATITAVTKAFTALLGGIAAISLLVGGIGIMNIMLVSVTERTREIGLRKAVGAKYRDLLAQFLIEAATLSLAGGLVGIVLGLVATRAITSVASLPFVFSPPALVVAFVFSAGVGVFFGLYPAHQAARLDPVDALRRE